MWGLDWIPGQENEAGGKIETQMHSLKLGSQYYRLPGVTCPLSVLIVTNRDRSCRSWQTEQKTLGIAIIVRMERYKHLKEWRH